MLDFANSALDYENLISFYFYQVWYWKKWIICRNIVADLSQGKISVCGKGKLVFVKSSSVNWSSAGEELLSLYTHFELRRWIDRSARLNTSARRYKASRQNWNNHLTLVIFWVCLRFRNIEIR